MKIPEKIYLSYENDDEDDKDHIFIDYMWHMHPFSRGTNIEYVREDAFIDKACEWLKSHSDYLRIHDNGKGVRFDMTQCVIDFRRAMKVE